MSFNGSGVFLRLYSWVNDAAANIKIRADRMDNEMDGFATGLSTCLTKDGQTTVTANLPMATFRHTGVGNAAARTDYASFGQVQDAKANWAAAAGTADAITAAYAIPITALVDGQECNFRASAANATTTPTFSPNGLTARTITRSGGSALAIGDIPGANAEVILRYNLANTRWELANPPNSSSFLDTVFRIRDDGDQTKLIAFQASGITTGTTRTLAAPDASGTLALTSNKLSEFAATTSLELKGVISDETGSGALVFANTPTLVTPVLGAATATSINFGGTTLATYVEGTYTPTLTNTTNITGSTAFLTRYTRVGNVVTVYGYVTINFTGAGNFALGMSLPIASNLGTLTLDLAGSGGANVTANVSTGIFADTANDRATFGGNVAAGGSRDINFTFHYFVI